jgi:hypothetical protein
MNFAQVLVLTDHQVILWIKGELKRLGIKTWKAYWATDLNYCWLLEETLNDREWINYLAYLGMVLGYKRDPKEVVTNYRMFAHVSASTRARMLLLVIYERTKKEVMPLN